MGETPLPSHSARYSCSVCGLAVLVTPDHEHIKACTCVGSVVANMTSTLAGFGGIV